ncbi:MAG: hypothetical protein NTV25_08395 [Methanothrix sp.]|nr:hypothetical protein [Methanothrix sp.]
MNKQFIYFTSIMVLMVATIVAVPAQENQAVLSNIIINNTTLNAIPNETLDANLTSSDNGTVRIPAPVAPVENTIANKTSEPKGDTIFPIGGGLKSNQIFQIHGNAKPTQTYEVGMPIKPLRDTSKMFFACNII